MNKPFNPEIADKLIAVCQEAELDELEASMYLVVALVALMPSERMAHETIRRLYDDIGDSVQVRNAHH